VGSITGKTHMVVLDQNSRNPGTEIVA